MSLVEILLLAVGLAMDALAVASICGVAIHRLHVRHAIRVAFFFGGFQAIMPLAGWTVGAATGAWLAGINRYVAFGLLLVIGLKMIAEAFQWRQEERIFNPLSTRLLLVLALATSMDALAVGFTLSLMGSSIIGPALMIGLVTFLLSLSGVYLGACCGRFFGSKLELAGGLILIGMGLRILLA